MRLFLYGFGVAGYFVAAFSLVACHATNQSELDRNPSSLSVDLGIPDSLRLNEVHVLGTHNSYHHQKGFSLIPSYQYAHPNLEDQLNLYGIRAFEFDVHRPRDNRDLEVYHVGSVDSSTSCLTLRICLTQLRAWSKENPNHLPLFAWIELKQGAAGGLPFDKIEHFDLVDQIINDVFGRESILAPEDIQGNYNSLQEAIEKKGWPLLNEARGKVLFMLDRHNKMSSLYLRQDRSLAGRMMFPRADEQDLDAPWAVVIKSDPGSLHEKALQKNFLISANICAPQRSDKECSERLANAIRAGTHLLMDDRIGSLKKPESESEQLFTTTEEYILRLPSGQAIECNKKASVQCEQ